MVRGRSNNIYLERDEWSIYFPYTCVPCISDYPGGHHEACHKNHTLKELWFCIWEIGIRAFWHTEIYGMLGLGSLYFGILWVVWCLNNAVLVTLCRLFRHPGLNIYILKPSLWGDSMWLFFVRCAPRNSGPLSWTVSEMSELPRSSDS